jgi:hypothetical protein
MWTKTQRKTAPLIQKRVGGLRNTATDILTAPSLPPSPSPQTHQSYAIPYSLIKQSDILSPPLILPLQQNTHSHITFPNTMVRSQDSEQLMAYQSNSEDQIKERVIHILQEAHNKLDRLQSSMAQTIAL